MKLIYFDQPGRDVPIKKILDYGKVPYEFVAWKKEEFAEKKNTLPFGQLPVMELDDGTIVAQSFAILSYAAEKANMMPTDAKDKACALSISVTLNETIESVIAPLYMAKDPEAKAAILKEIVEVKLPVISVNLENYIKSFGGKGYIIGDKPTYIDIYAGYFLFMLNSGFVDASLATFFQSETYTSILNNFKTITGGAQN